METERKITMPSADVLSLYSQFKGAGIRVWVDGGWGVDALLEKQTRPHGDLDVALEFKDVPKAREILEAQGFKDVIKDDTSEWNFVMGDETGRQIDLHAFVLDKEGNIEKGIQYPKGSLTGTGSIDGEPVECIAPDFMVKFHTGYKIRESDIQDVTALCEKFGIEYPEEYVQFKK